MPPHDRNLGGLGMRFVSLAAAVAACAGFWTSVAQAAIVVGDGQYASIHLTYAPGTAPVVNGSTVGSYIYGYLDFSHVTEYAGIMCSGDPLFCSSASLSIGSPTWLVRQSGDDLFIYVANHSKNYDNCGPQTIGRELCSVHVHPIDMNYSVPLEEEVVWGSVPEPATWVMMIAGFGLAGSTLRRRRAVPA
jgi:hypothetical protein